MNYHLNRNGQNLGVFSLEELQRRRASGELTGAELVWTEGIAAWQPLDSLLTPPPIIPPPPKVNASKSSPVFVWVLVIVVLVLAGAIVAGVVGYRTYVRPMIEQLTQSTAGNSSGPFAQMTAMEAASKPVVVGSNTLTAAEVIKTEGEFRIRQYLDGYKSYGMRNPECDALALGMISNWIACNYGGVVDTNLPSLADLGNRLAADTNCVDPVVLTVAGVNAAELHEAVRRLERAVDGFQNSKYPGYPKFYATESLAEKLIYDRSERLPVLDAQGLEELRSALADGSIRPEDQPEMADILVSGWGRGFFYRNPERVYTMVEKQGKQFQWLALALKGESEINAAWQARGGGYANTVSSSGWEGFSKHMALAREYYTQAWELNTNWPLAPDRMIYVSLGDSGIGEMRKWFDRTVAVQIDYADAWVQMRWGLRPRWYGDTDSMLAFGRTALNTRRFDTDVPRIYFDSLSDVESEMGLPSGQHIYDRPDVWPSLKSLYEGYIAYPSQTEWTRDGWRGAYACVAYLAGKYDIAREQLQQLNWRLHPYNLSGWGRDMSLMPLEVAARRGPQSRKVQEAENDRKYGDIGAALQIYNELAATTNMDDRTRSFVRERQYSLGMEQHLRAGDWVPFLPPDAALTGWQTNFGDFKRLPDGALQVSSDENGHMIYCRTPIGTEFEAKGQFEVVSSTTKAFQAGLVMGLPEYDSYHWDSFRIKRNDDEGDVAAFSEHWIKRQILAHLENLNSRSNSFDLRLQGGLVSATVNGDIVFTNAQPPENYYLVTNEFLIGLGAFNDSDSTVIRYRNLQIRRLPGE
jgi:hypothetical protein